MSRKFYDTFGDDIANELVEWFNQVDATYRADLRELNELNFQRFDAKLGQRTADVRGEIRQLATDGRSEFKQLAVELRADMGVLESRLDQRVAELRQGQAELRAGLGRWMFVFWMGSIVPLGGLMVALMR